MSGLSDLLNQLNTEQWSTRRISREAERHGHELSYSTASRYFAGRHGAATPEVLDAFAAVFRVDVNELRRAASLRGVYEPFDLGPEAARLSGPQREAIRHLVRVMLEDAPVEGEPESDGATDDLRQQQAVKRRAYEYLNRQLRLADRVPDWDILPREARESVLEIYSNVIADLVSNGQMGETSAQTLVEEQASRAAEEAIVGIERRADDDSTSGPDTDGHRGWSAARRDVLAEPMPSDTNPGRSGSGEGVHPIERGSNNADDRPWEQDEYGLAAKRGRNRGRESREQQDREAEDGGA